MVNTVSGPVKADELGKTLMHEHFYVGYPGYSGNTLYEKEFSELVELGVEVANKAKAQGVQTIVDPTPNDCGRSPELLKAVSEETGLNIICATGYYYEAQGAPAYFNFKKALGTGEEELYELMLGEITNGIGKTGIKPGIIKIGSGNGSISEYEEMFFKVAAKVQQETGLPILTHTEQGTMGPEQAKLLISEGVDPKKILIGHMDGNTDIQYQLKTLKQGVYIGFDRFGLSEFAGAPLDEERLVVLAGLIGSGYENQIMLSHDTVNIWLGGPTIFPDELAKLLENWEIQHVIKNIIPKLEAGGVSKESINSTLR